MGSTAGLLLIESHRSTGPGAAAARESVYAVQVDWPEEGAYGCWVWGETRAYRRLVCALDHVRGHLEYHPYHCGEIHIGGRIESASPLPLVPFGEWCGPSLFFTGPHLNYRSFSDQSFICAEALKDHATELR